MVESKKIQLLSKGKGEKEDGRNSSHFLLKVEKKEGTKNDSASGAKRDAKEKNYL